jgi:hypothetical protein
MNITSTAELRRFEVERDTRGERTWVDRLENFWSHLANSLMLQASKRRSASYLDDIEPIMSIGDD